jgi:cell division protein FtsW
MGKTHQPDHQLIVLISLNLIIGLIILTSASSIVGLEKFNDPYFFLKHQIIYGLLPGLILFFLLAKLDYHYYHQLGFIFFILAIILLILVFIPGLSYTRGEAKRWISIFGFSFQPAELTKLFFLIYLANWLEKRGKKIKSWSNTFLPLVISLFVISILIALQPDLGTLIVIFAMTISVYFLAGAPISHLIVLISGILASVFLLIKIAPYRLARLIVFLYPEFDPKGLSYHLHQALIAIGSGKLFGLGLGQSRQKFFYLPEAYADSIFAVIAEELGFFLTVLIIFLYFYIFYRGLKIAKKAPDLFGQFLGFGVLSLYIFQAIINIGSLLRLFPLTGLPLPLISYGGSSMITILAGFGILINISSHAYVD